MLKLILKKLRPKIEKIFLEFDDLERENIAKADETNDWNSDFKEAYQKGLFEKEPAFITKDGTPFYRPAGSNGGEEYKILQGKFISGNGIHQDHDELAIRKERLSIMLSEKKAIEKQLINGIINQEEKTDLVEIAIASQTLTSGIQADLAFGNQVFHILEISALIFVSPLENPYTTDETLNLAKISKWSSELERLYPFFFGLPIFTMYNLPNPYTVDSVFASMEEMKGDQISTQTMLSLQAIKLIGEKKGIVMQPESVLILESLQELHNTNWSKLRQLNTSD